MILQYFHEVLRFLPNLIFVFRCNYLNNKFLIFNYLITVGRAGHWRVSTGWSARSWSGLVEGWTARGWLKPSPKDWAGPRFLPCRSPAAHLRVTWTWVFVFFVICFVHAFESFDNCLLGIRCNFQQLFWPNCWFDFTRAAFFFLTWLWFVLIHVTDILNFFSGF